VVPGDITVPRGASIDVVAELTGFSAEEAFLLVRRQGAADPEVIGMHPDGRERFTSRLFGLDSSFTYLVDADGVTSREHRVVVTDLPAVRTLSLELDYPGYTGLVTEVNDGGGDVAAVVGTTVEVRPQLTMPVSAAVLRFDDGRRVPFALIDSLAPVARFRVAQNSFYSIDLVAPDGTMVPGTIRWAVDALPDRPPVVRITEPGRDTRATNVEEVSLAVAVDDDYGVSSVRLVASVNGGDEQSIPLAGGLPPGTLTPRAVHTLFLEELDLSPGDLVSYHAVARDGAGNEASSDIYFVEIRPYSRNYRQAEQGGAAGEGQGEQQGDEQDLSREQRRLIVATFNVRRDSSDTPAPRLSEDVATIAAGQERLRDRVEELANDMLVRGAAAVDSVFVDIRAALDSSGRAMDTAAGALRRGRLADALPLEQQSLQQLQRAEALYRDVQMQLNEGGGGGGGGAAPEDLADLFDLERDQLRNQYEAVQREASGGGAEREVDQARERLRELARRLEQENERQQRMMTQRGQQSASGGSSGSAQRRFAEEAEEEARRLERLAREQDTPELRQAAQAARSAAD
ncbi:MAG TPA: DUF4175 family protein, partial [Gemmatimonadales bacterium]|nr:DUF4175 family protein [Gemmatimonadales bacterium]